MGSSSGFTPSDPLGIGPDPTETTLDRLLIEQTKTNMLLTILVAQFTGGDVDFDLVLASE